MAEIALSAHAALSEACAPSAAHLATTAQLAEIRHIVHTDLVPLVGTIDADGTYPEAVLRALGGAGAYSAHVGGAAGTMPDLWTAIEAMSIAGEHCLSTAFCMWCQDALGWYIHASDNEELKADLGQRVARGEALGGTALSNPMKAFYGIERMRLKGRRVDGGYEVKGLLPWVSNLGPDHYFGAIFEVENGAGGHVMAVLDCSAPGMKITQNDNFVALDGTRTFAVQVRDVFVPDKMLLADPLDAYLQRIRAGFILLQAGMAFGLIRGCVKLMQQVKGSLGHVNQYLEKQPEDFEVLLAQLETVVEELCRTPFSKDPAYFRKVVEARLAAGEASVEAAHYAMLHQGARGYVAQGAAQRRLREAYFVAIVTPATKQLRKMLAEIES
ncbi:MAG: acyl-CoA/acyl-ACP dehydrogenase [Hyphomicrobiaceae bacterium]|nr:acyl-CoA/acyl-ACP dehydrogenase [Hyphomicrobiaceae bacterium]